MTEFPLMICALRRNKGTVVLLVALIAFSVAVVTNCGFLIFNVVTDSLTSTGVDESNIGIIQNIGVIGKSDGLPVAENLAQLERLPFVKATAFGLPPLAGVSEIEVANSLTQPPDISVSYFEGSQGFQETLGLKVIEGKLIDANDIPDAVTQDKLLPILITQQLAIRLFGKQNCIGELVYSESRRFRVAGVIATLKSTIPEVTDLSIVASQRFHDERYGGIYLIRSKPGHIDSALALASKKLHELNPYHVQPLVQTFSKFREDRLSKRVALAQVLALLVAIQSVVTSFSMGSLTSLWVTQRKIQIGIRRALGSTASQVRVYFLIENLIIAGVGSTFGVVLGIVCNRLLMQIFEVAQIPWSWCLFPFILSIFVGQMFALGPAISASRVSPGIIMRI